MANIKRPEARKSPPHQRRLIILSVIGATILLLLFNTAFWFNRYVFSSENFNSIASSALLSDSSTDALANEVSDRLLQDRPVLKSVLSDRTTRLIAALLNTDLSERIVKKTVTTLHIAVTSSNPQVVAIDLSNIKNIIAQVLEVGRTLTDRPAEAQRIDVNQIPDQIVLLDPKDLPNIYTLGVTMLWLAPITIIGTLILLAWPIYKAWSRRKQLSQLIAIQGGALLLGGLLALALGPLIKPPTLAPIESPNIRIVTENLIDAFILKFNEQSFWVMILPGLVFLVVALVLYLWPTIQRQLKRS